MADISAPVSAFLLRRRMSPAGIDLQVCTDQFLSQMQIGLYGGESSIPMLPTYLSPLGTPALNTPTAVIDAGGTRLRVALVTLTEEGPRVEALEEMTMPGVEFPASWDDFLFCIAELGEDLFRRADRIGFSFSYPTAVAPDGEGTVIGLNKQVVLDGCEGQPVCAGLTRELESRGITGKPVTLLNDSAAALLAGKVFAPGADRCYGFICGTGVNVCCAAPGTAILKKPVDMPLTLINTESGSFTGVPYGDADQALDRFSGSAGLCLYEKMVGGAYLGDVFRYTVLKAVEDGLFTFPCGRNFLSLTHLDTAQLDEFLRNPEGDGMIASFCRDASDRETALAIAEGLLDRAARLLCANLSAVLLLTGGGKDADKPAVFMADGSVIRKSLLLPMLREYLKQFTAAQLGRYAKLVTADHVTLVGTAAAALISSPSAAD